jgi:hypothetical protein
MRGQCDSVQRNSTVSTACDGSACQSEYDIASLYMVSVYCFVTKACARRPGAAASVERRRASRSDTLAASQAFERMHILW